MTRAPAHLSSSGSWRRLPASNGARAIALLALTTALAVPDWSAAQDAAASDSSKSTGSTFIPFPFYMYSPETKSGIGIVITYFRRPHDAPANERPSTYSASFVITQRKQVAVGAGFEHYWDAERYQLQGGVVFSKFPDTFFGVGNDTDADVSEDYTPRTFAAAASLRREIAPNLRLGPNANYVYQEMAEVEEGGILAGQELPGSTGGTLVQAGVSAGWDVRDNIVYPRTGGFAELGFTVSDDAIGSDFLFTSWNVDLRRYVSLSGSQVIVIRGVATFMLGTPPFQALAMLGGDRVLRGYYAGRFRDRQRYALQAEYRLGFWKRMGVTAFADVGDVAHDVSNFHLDQIRFAGGFGLRFLLSKSEGATLRADFGTGDDGSSGMYLSMLEAY
jgi:outer membrane protein assembly factor BamA